MIGFVLYSDRRYLLCLAYNINPYLQAGALSLRLLLIQPSVVIALHIIHISAVHLQPQVCPYGHVLFHTVQTHSCLTIASIDSHQHPDDLAF